MTRSAANNMQQLENRIPSISIVWYQTRELLDECGGWRQNTMAHSIIRGMPDFQIACTADIQVLYRYSRKKKVLYRYTGAVVGSSYILVMF